MQTYNTPGVYVEEISTLPPSVAEVATAVPAFIGYTERRRPGPADVAEIGTLLEFERRFGGPKPSGFKADATGAVTRVGDDATPEFFLYYAISLYFRNGGGRCFVVSVGDHDSTPSGDDFLRGLEAVAREDQPTLIVMPESVRLAQEDFDPLCQGALAQCAELGDRFAIFDVRGGDVEKFRAGLGQANLMYGAAYHPYLQTALTHHHDEGTVLVAIDGNDVKLSEIRSSNSALYNKIKRALSEQRVVLPPSAGIAGVYARVDRERGVWKAPANVDLASVIGPVTQITHAEQDLLNVEPSTGKSINAIRVFPGKGTLVWGARTLAGNDNEWRYVPVRRLFLTIEESARKASAFAVFEPNDATTWLKVKGMLDSYLHGLWERGALQGSTPEAAYYIHIGLGRTMTPQDVLEGRMIVELGIAAVRPAEFIVLRFSHKLADS